MAEDKVLKADSNEMELVDFRIYKQGQHKVYEGIYGVNVAKVKEIIKIPALTELPGVPEYIEGVFDLRGVVIPVINLAKWMNIIEPKDMVLKPRIIIAEFSNIMIGFIVHEAKRIRRINASDIRGSDFSTNTGGFDKSQITGIAKIENDEVLLILDLERIVEELGIYSPKIDIEEKEIKKMTGTAVVLDDSSTARKLVRDALDKMGFKVIEAKDGVDGLNKMNELYEAYKGDIANQVKVIISDVEMPQMDGFHFASRVREDIRFKGIPIIFNSSLSNEFSTLKSKDVGGDAFLTKFDANVFYKEVSRVIESYINK
ncbi:MULTISPECIES: chemotaxis protein [unclassified Campylobacter]|uniref:chemotaxis protein n=1 Tax=unclassified Campylobacter TaxID=2593542 RepID=UPI001BDB2C8E|nr:MULTISPECIES: chemotaxis protein [unclassified Campylobacter]MBZ7975914.1 chemotaxis protein CheV [Campylobacter sp. RM12637]MBZ7979547.1 chemotaxis protein CheV [Campylobacter sp. RM12642]MBZ7990433.1 chemotaxis protein CheV [Campylobacter sp. RM9331]MBZ8005078.1 chemotaxis protein CheV [Campylobacter sp. RM9332]MBZ8006952.1 chemotaxis protein CheV [Campylobacter sp. RM9334]